MSAPRKARPKARRKAASGDGQVFVDLALQGGGSHGAYTWGVLDRLLADDRIEIEAISGTSAGAMNAVVLAEGMVEGGRAKARRQLADFWHRVAGQSPASATSRIPVLSCVHN